MWHAYIFLKIYFFKKNVCCTFIHDTCLLYFQKMYVNCDIELNKFAYEGHFDEDEYDNCESWRKSFYWLVYIQNLLFRVSYIYL